MEREDVSFTISNESLELSNDLRGSNSNKRKLDVYDSKIKKTKINVNADNRKKQRMPPLCPLFSHEIFLIERLISGDRYLCVNTNHKGNAINRAQ